MNVRRALALLAVVGFTGLIAFLALRSSPNFIELRWMPHGFAVWADRHGVFRNVLGFFAFAFVILAILGPRVWYVATLCLFATALEVAQLWIPSRVFDLQDIVASLAGILLAWPCAWLLRRCFVRA